MTTSQYLGQCWLNVGRHMAALGQNGFSRVVIHTYYLNIERYVRIRIIQYVFANEETCIVLSRYQIVLYFLYRTVVLSFSIDVVLTLSISRFDKNSFTGGLMAGTFSTRPIVYIVFHALHVYKSVIHKHNIMFLWFMYTYMIRLVVNYCRKMLSYVLIYKVSLLLKTNVHFLVQYC